LLYSHLPSPSIIIDLYATRQKPPPLDERVSVPAIDI
jgi:hypothetical protein